MLDKQQSHLIYQYIGEKLKTKRQALHLTQQQLATRLGLTRASIANIESGSQHAPLDVIFSLAKELEYNSFYHVLPDFDVVNTSEPSSIAPLLIEGDAEKYLQINRPGHRNRAAFSSS